MLRPDKIIDIDMAISSQERCGKVDSVLVAAYRLFWQVGAYLLRVYRLPVYAFRIYDDLIELSISRRGLLSFIGFLKLHMTFKYSLLLDIVAVDRVRSRMRFFVYFILLSVSTSQRCVLRLCVDELKGLPSVVCYFPGANWMEREVWDMFGILFIGHPDLRRIHTDYGFLGFPLRKDFPLTGFYELYYDDLRKRIVMQPVVLAQEFRYYTFNNPWLGDFL